MNTVSGRSAGKPGCILKFLNRLTLGNATKSKVINQIPVVGYFCCQVATVMKQKNYEPDIIPLISVGSLIVASCSNAAISL